MGSAVIIASIGDRLPRGIFMLGGAALYGSGVVAFAASPWFNVSMLLMIIIGLANVCCHALVQTVLQTYSPPEFRGRTMSMFQLSNVVMTVGSILLGALATLAGTQWAVALMGGAGALTMLGIYLTMPSAWRIR
ncbi:MAG TPA: MFS transporter [Acidobacteriota bacterium]|nr:MFS transporter [Acidobacteriota bacterium]